MKTISFVLAALFLSSSVMAQEAPLAPLPPGKPAGVKQANGSDQEAPYLLAAVGVSVILGVTLFKFGKTSTTAAPTTTTP